MVDIFIPNHSKGLLLDALILQQALASKKTRLIEYPLSACVQTIQENDKSVNFEPSGNIAIFIERVFKHSRLGDYKKRVFIPNPEWFSSHDVGLVTGFVDEIWHKTRFSEQQLGKKFTGQRHRYIGFTSFSSKKKVSNYEYFAHFRGKSKNRHTQDLIDIWLDTPELPPLTVQTYGNGISIPQWINIEKIRMYIGFLDDESYQNEFSKNGIHLCTSQTEGFGHYLNEARSAAGLVIALDAPPMNELIDKSCGILIPVEDSTPMNQGIKFFASKKGIKSAIIEAIEMPMEIRKERGANALKRYLAEKRDFVKRINEVIDIDT